MQKVNPKKLNADDKYELSACMEGGRSNVLARQVEKSSPILKNICSRLRIRKMGKRVPLYACTWVRVMPGANQCLAESRVHSPWLTANIRLCSSSRSCGVDLCYAFFFIAHNYLNDRNLSLCSPPSVPESKIPWPSWHDTNRVWLQSNLK